MNEEQHRTWWEELANQYEEWAEEPPRSSEGDERYTCNALDQSNFGFCFQTNNADDLLLPLWVDVYGRTSFPAGCVSHKDRSEKRFDFCHHMAEAIREYLEAENAKLKLDIKELRETLEDEGVEL